MREVREDEGEGRRRGREVREDEGHFLCYGRGSKSMGEQAQNNL